MARVYVFFVVYSAGAGEEELSTETFSEREFLADKRRTVSYTHLDVYKRQTNTMQMYSKSIQYAN